MDDMSRWLRDQRNPKPAQDTSDTTEETSSTKQFPLSRLEDATMYHRLAQAFWQQAVSTQGIFGAQRAPSHYERIVKDVAIAIKYYIEDNP
jgi:hypothetical protein